MATLEQRLQLLERKVAILYNKPSQQNILGDVRLDNSYDGLIIKVKWDSVITIPNNLPTNFSCVFRTYPGITATFVAGTGVTLDALDGLTLEEGKMATLFKDNNENNFILEGELTT